MRRFREAFSAADLYDLGYEGDQFTWCNCHPEPDTIYVRLDRVCADPIWRSRFPSTVVRHIPTILSDHAVIMVDSENTPRPPWIKHKPFWFEAAWASSPDCEQIVRESWTLWIGHPSSSLLAKQKVCAARLQDWNSTTRAFHNRRWVKVCEEKILGIQHQLVTAKSKLEENKIRADMEQLLTEEEVYRKQRGKIHWLWEGDGNTSFFHNKISTRRRTNAITPGLRMARASGLIGRRTFGTILRHIFVTF
ncbi:UNVERIFIED_CONTAM: hypothetical protein Sradi_2625600 [Sesamum radiatum]|uniref:Uncharacterized protein n=1 Tax=Sesamum radiatum TaxID=300843 RepID=A0AAW2S722_SESRA